jgi:hypothetical protein
MIHEIKLFSWVLFLSFELRNLLIIGVKIHICFSVLELRNLFQCQWTRPINFNEI